MKETRTATRTYKGIPAARGSSEAALWKRLLRPQGEELSQHAARYILTRHFGRADLSRMNALATKARDNNLNLAEHLELYNYGRAGHVLSLMKSRVRIALKNTRATA